MGSVGRIRTIAQLPAGSEHQVSEVGGQRSEVRQQTTEDREQQGDTVKGRHGEAEIWNFGLFIADLGITELEN